MLDKVAITLLEKFDTDSSIKTAKKIYYESSNKIESIRDFFKRCPSCGILWMRAEGC